MLDPTSASAGPHEERLGDGKVPIGQEETSDKMVVDESVSSLGEENCQSKAIEALTASSHDEQQESKAMDHQPTSSEASSNAPSTTEPSTITTNQMDTSNDAENSQDKAPPSVTVESALQTTESSPASTQEDIPTSSAELLGGGRKGRLTMIRGVASAPVLPVSQPIKDEEPKVMTTLDVVTDEDALLKMAQERNRTRKRGGGRPNTRHETQSLSIEENDWLTAGYCEFQGSRPAMEDALHCNLSYRKFDNKNSVMNETFIGLFDGHGGATASKHASQILHSIFLDKLTRYETLLEQYYEASEGRNDLREEGQDLLRRLNNHFTEKEKQQTTEEDRFETINILDVSSVDAIQLLIRESFLEANEIVCEKNSVDGTTASLVYLPTIDSQFLFVGNVGDSRVVLCRDGKPITLTFDHRPTDNDERRRVRDAGKSIVNNRISACLAVTRSIGDKTFHPGIISDPHTSAIRLCDKDEFLIIACDGIFDFVSEEEAIKEIREETNPILASTKLRDYAYHKKGSNDNISVIIVRFKNHFKEQF